MKVWIIALLQCCSFNVCKMCTSFRDWNRPNQQHQSTEGNAKKDKSNNENNKIHIYTSNNIHTQDWLVEHGFTSAPTQYRLYGRRFFIGLMTQTTLSKHWRRWLVIQTGLNLTRLTSPCYNTTICMVKIGPRLLLKSNRKSYTGSRLVLKSMTLDDLEGSLCALFQNTCDFRSSPWKFEWR